MQSISLPGRSDAGLIQVMRQTASQFLFPLNQSISQRSAISTRPVPTQVRNRERQSTAWPRAPRSFPLSSAPAHPLPGWATRGGLEEGKKNTAGELNGGAGSKRQKREKKICIILSRVFKQKVKTKELVGAVYQHCSSCDWKLSSHLLTYLVVKIYVSIHSQNLILFLKNKM